MSKWTEQDAKSKFGEMLKSCLVQGPQTVTRHGVEVAVLVCAKEWRRMQSAATPSLKSLLLMESAQTEALTLERGRLGRPVRTKYD